LTDYFHQDRIPGDSCDTTPDRYQAMNKVDERLRALSTDLQQQIRHLTIPYDVMFRVKLIIADAYLEGLKKGREDEPWWLKI
jgi:hypothetical protein